MACLVLSACAGLARPERELVVTATAYNSLPGQGSGDPTLAAWGDRLRPGVRAIAVSRDLIELGLTRGTRVRIEGLPGEYVVLDKMAKRWQRRIDIYMGTDREAALRWGRRQVRIFWWPPSGSPVRSGLQHLDRVTSRREVGGRGTQPVFP